MVGLVSPISSFLDESCERTRERVVNVLKFIKAAKEENRPVDCDLVRKVLESNGFEGSNGNYALTDGRTVILNVKFYSAHYLSCRGLDGKQSGGESLVQFVYCSKSAAGCLNLDRLDDWISFMKRS